MNDIQKYLTVVCEQIRFQKAHDSIKKELQSHISDQTAAFMEEGLNEQQAIQKAIDEMGDAVDVGTALDRVHKPTIKWSFIVFAIALSFAAIMLQMTMQPTLQGISKTTILHIPYFLIALLFSIMAMVIFYHIDFTILAFHSKTIYFIYVSLIAILRIFLELQHFRVNGKLYFNLLGYHFSPLMIYLFPVVLVGLLYDCRGKSYCSILLCSASFLPPALLLFSTGVNTAIFVIGIVSILLIATAICKNWFAVKKSFALLLLLLLLTAAFLFCSYLFASRLDELHFAIVDPFGDDFIKNMLQNNIKGAHFIGTGEMILYSNVGEELNIVPAPFFNDLDYFVAYALHFLGCFFVILLFIVYLFFIVKGFFLAAKQKSQLGSMTALAVLFTYFVIAVWNITVNSGFFLNVSPLELPFFSTNTTANILFFMLLGILLSVFRTGKYIEDKTNTKQNHFIDFSKNTITITIPILRKSKKS